MMNPFGSITLLTLIPLVGGLIVAALPPGQKTLARRLGLDGTDGVLAMPPLEIR